MTWLICNCPRAPIWLHMQTTTECRRITTFHTLNTAMCKQMVITRRRTHQCLQFYLASQPLECVKNYKYHGVVIFSSLSWSEQIQSICDKSSKLMGMLYCQFYLSADSYTLLQFYCHASDHILNMHTQCGTITCQIIWTVRACWASEYSNIATKKVTSKGYYDVLICAWWQQYPWGCSTPSSPFQLWHTLFLCSVCSGAHNHLLQLRHRVV